MGWFPVDILGGHLDGFVLPTDRHVRWRAQQQGFRRMGQRSDVKQETANSRHQTS